MSGETPPPGSPRPLRDQEARDRIETALDENILVEAGAGSGKTTALTDRMVALVLSGTAGIDEIAAVTFTRKAAAELRERFQGALEAKLNEIPPDSPESDLLNKALRSIDRAFLGTIHAFCARLLRERPLEAGIDPAFEETPEADMLRLRKSYWHSFLERLVSEEDPVLEELTDVGLRPDMLEAAFDTVCDNLDVPFAADEAAVPADEAIDVTRRELEHLLDRGLELMPAAEPHSGWDTVQRRLRELSYRRDVQGWSDRRRFFEALSLLLGRASYSVVQNRWSDSSAGRAEAKRFRDDLNTFVGEGGPARDLHNQWLAHRYAIAIRLVTRAAGELAAHRRREGRLDFQDLLLLAANLLRENPGARKDLGLRYRRVLVDEFQDTDPLQAEVLLLLASEPETAGEDWRTAVPRAGALFVVGDPKQSIYRFRRADIVVYDFVRRRFEEFGEVLELVMNFRSRPGIADLVNRTFGEGGLFPEHATSHQAAFSPLVVQPKDESAPREGVFRYGLASSGTQRSRAEHEAELLAEWVTGRIDGDGRNPGDFLVLTRNRKHLDVYARALEQRNIPVDVSGARVGVEAELSELMTLLAALADPEDEVKTVAVLTGLFFGLDLEKLTEHRLCGGSFRATADPARRSRGTEEVREALGRLHSWWLRGVHVPADVLLGELCAELGLLPYATTGSLGGIRAGAIAYGLDAVRCRALAGDASLVGAVEALESALAWEDAETPFEPGRQDLVRVMNVHRAKGLEAPVVVLTGAELESDHPVKLHVERPATGDPVAYMVLQRRAGRHRWIDLARPPEWTRHQAEEKAFDAAERVRLLYVAGTRAQDELVVGHIPGKDRSPWQGYDEAVSALATTLDLRPGRPPDKEELEVTPTEIEQSIRAAREARQALASPTYLMEPVTALAKERLDPEDPKRLAGESTSGSSPVEPGGASGGPRGYEWGSAVHAALAAAARGMEGEPFRLFCRTLLVEYELPVDETGEPRNLEDLLDLVSQVQASELWQRAAAAEERHVELPFAAPYEGHEAPADVPMTVEGVVDLAFREPDGWVIADYKTDRGDDPEFERRTRAYRRQVDIYADCWAALTGDPVRERVLFFTALGRAESW